MKDISATFVQQIQRLFGIRGGISLSLAEEVVPIVSAGDLQRPPFAMRGSGSYADQAGPGGAGTFTAYVLSNPLTSSAVVVVRATAAGAAGAGDQLFLHIGQEPFDTIPTAAATDTRPIDTRRISSSATINQVKVGSANLGAAIASTQRIGMVRSSAANQMQQLPVADAVAILAPGGFLAWQNLTANSYLNVFFSWEEHEIL